MPIPDFQTLMLPLLKFTSDNQEHTLREAIEALGSVFNLTNEEKQKLLPSGAQPVFDNRIGWSKTHLLKAGLLQSPRRSYFRITERGINILAQNPSSLNMTFLKQYPEYVEFATPRNNNHNNPIIEHHEITRSTPAELLEESYQKIRSTLAHELLEKVKNCTAEFFERLVVELLVKMGYGGSLKDAGRATRLTNDGGIDGIIKEDKLGLDVIYIQAKKWTNSSVGRPDIQNFVGALAGMQANKGVFITTSKFASSAIEYAKMVPSKIILIDGEQLADYMIDYGLGVSNFATYELKKIDNDYFGE
ncbi:MAG: restriction endonuclease [Chloroflexota bacterium]